MKHLHVFLIWITLAYLEECSSAVPTFASPGAQTISVIEGRGVALDCLVHNVGNKRPIVKWLRARDSKVLAIGSKLYINNPRFRAYHNKDSENIWTLEIFRVGPEDDGEYECQVTSDRPLVTITKKFRIQIERLPMFIQGGKNQIFEEGTTIELSCIFHKKPFKNQGFWFHAVNRKAKSVTAIEELNAVEVVETAPVMRSILVIPNARPETQGEYLCRADEKWVTWVAVKVVPKGILRSSALNKESSSSSSGSSSFGYRWMLNASLVFIGCLLHMIRNS